MTSNINPPMPHSDLPPSNIPPAWLTKLGDQVEQWLDNDNNPDCSLFNQVQEYLVNIEKGPGPYPSQQQFTSDLQSKFFSGAGNQDVYMLSGLGSASPVQDFMKLFGLPSPPVTKMDQLTFKFQQEVQGPGLPKGGDQLFEDLHGEIMNLGSQGNFADFQKWAAQEKNSDAFKNASKDAQAFFNQFLQK